MTTYILATGNVLVFGNFPVGEFPTPARQYPENTLVLTQEALCISDAPIASSTLMLSQSVEVGKTIQLSAENTLVLSSNGLRLHELTATSSLSFSQSSFRVHPETPSSTLSLTQTVSVGRGISNTLVLSQTVVYNIVKLLTVTHILGLSQGAVGYIDSSWHFVALHQPPSVQTYNPDALQIPPTPTVPKAISFNTTLVFQNVDFGDVDRVEHTRINRRTIGEELIIYRDSRWPRTETLKFKIIDISASQGKSMLDFISVNLAQQITFVDWIGVTWLGVITNPNTMLTQSTRNQLCSGRYEIEIEFQGVQIQVPIPASNNLNLTGAAIGVL